MKHVLGSMVCVTVCVTGPACAPKSAPSVPSTTVPSRTDATTDASLAGQAADDPAGPRGAGEVPVVQRSPGARDLAIVDAASRLEEERTLDAGRKPAQLLAFLQVEPGARVADLMAGFGYTTELLARAVGPDGVVYAQNNRYVRDKFLEPTWTERLATAPMANVVRLDTELDAPFPADVHDLDLVTMVLFYHDTYWQQTDRTAMNAAVFAALRPGGSFVIVDHSAAPGAGASGAQTLHRVEASLVRQEVEAAGFALVEQADFLRNPDDPRDWNAAPRAAAEAGTRGQSDRFVYRFAKPQ